MRSLVFSVSVSAALAIAACGSGDKPPLTPDSESGSDGGATPSTTMPASPTTPSTPTTPTLPSK